jgi:hypothetical protein
LLPSTSFASSVGSSCRVASTRCFCLLNRARMAELGCTRRARGKRSWVSTRPSTLCRTPRHGASTTACATPARTPVAVAQRAASEPGGGRGLGFRTLPPPPPKPRAWPRRRRKAPAAAAARRGTSGITCGNPRTGRDDERRGRDDEKSTKREVSLRPHVDSPPLLGRSRQGGLLARGLAERLSGGGGPCRQRGVCADNDCVPVMWGPFGRWWRRWSEPHSPTRI